MMEPIHEERRFPPTSRFSEEALISSEAEYERLYKQSIEDPDTFWLDQAKTLDWIKFPTVACNYTWDMKSREIEHTWFADGSLNVSANCLDRHLESRGEKTAIIWQGETDGDVEHISYRSLYQRVCQMANVLKQLGVKKGDRVCLYLPMIPELAIAVLACARIGAIHNVVFGGFSSTALAHRLKDSDSRLLITANVSLRGGKKIPLKSIADAADAVEQMLVIKRTDDPCSMQEGRDIWYHEVVSGAENHCPPEPLNAEDPLFILYTSGSTGKPKGVLHTQAGYLLHTSLTHKYLFDLKEEDVYWCTADIGWITGHSYVIYGPLANGATTLMFEGTPTYPDAGRFWQVVEKHQVSLFYTAPTAIRALVAAGDHYPNQYNLNSLRLLGTVGEPINPETWIWYHTQIGGERCPIVDTWWQTETGGIMIASFPGAHTLKPGSAGRPFFGVLPEIRGRALCIARPSPGMMRTTWGDHDRFIDTYFSRFENGYFTGDSASVDQDGDYWLLGRMDDVVNISGHRIGTAEVESALVSHPDVAESAVVGVPHPIKGEGLYAFVTLVVGKSPKKQELLNHVRHEIGPIAQPETIQFAEALPKTRSGKIMRRILRKIASGDTSDLGDITTLADPSAVERLIKEKEDV